MRKIKAFGLVTILIAFAMMFMGSGSSTPSSTQTVSVESKADEHDDSTNVEAVQDTDNNETDEETETEKTTKSDEVLYEITDTNFEYYTNSIGGVEYYGYVEITNTGDNNLYLDKAIFDLEDNDGHLLQSDDFISSAPSVIKPGEKGYFYNGLGSNMIDEGVSTDNGINLVPQITIKQATGEPVRYEVTDTDLREEEYSGLKVTGRVINNTDEDVSYLYLNVIFYDANGKVLGITGTSVSDLAAGNKASFECTTMFANDNLTMDNVADYEIIAEETYMQF